MRPILALAAVLALTAPAYAQDAAEPKVNQLIVFGDDPCPASDDGTITVCARKAEGERYRIPEELRESNSPQNEAWNNKVLAYERVGRTGTMSCSPTGAGGWTGCSGQLIDQAYAEKQSAPELRFAELIAAEREKRLATVDLEAAETQKRVEELEKQMEERQKAAEEGKDPFAEEPLPAPPPK
jgi:hypothetical protein